MNQQWRPVVGYAGYYEVSNFGGLRSVTRQVGYRGGRLKTVQGKPMRVNRVPGRYVLAQLNANGVTRSFALHTLVLEAFVSPRPPGMQACHFNGDKHDNRVANLRWGTLFDNRADGIRLGEITKGSSHHNAKLSEADVVQIRAQYQGGSTQTALAATYGVSQFCIGTIVRRKAWRHV